MIEVRRSPASWGWRVISALATVVAVGSLAVAGPVFAEPGDGGSAPAAQGIVALDDSTTPVDLSTPGSMDSVNMELLANIPKNGSVELNEVFDPMAGIGTTITTIRAA